MTDIQLTVILSAIVPTLAALGAMIVSVINAVKGNQQREDAKKAIAEVHSAVNGKSLAAENKIDALHKQIETLTAVAAQSRETAALLAQAAQVPRPDAPSEVVVVNPASDPVRTTQVKKL